MIGPGPRVRKGAPVQQLAVTGPLLNRVAKVIARVPGRAAVQMLANLADGRDQDPCASAIDARTRPTLMSARIGAGNASMIAAACLSSAAFPGERASADA